MLAGYWHSCLSLLGGPRWHTGPHPLWCHPRTLLTSKWGKWAWGLCPPSEPLAWPAPPPGPPPTRWLTCPDPSSPKVSPVLSTLWRHHLHLRSCLFTHFCVCWFPPGAPDSWAVLCAFLLVESRRERRMQITITPSASTMTVPLGPPIHSFIHPTEVYETSDVHQAQSWGHAPQVDPPIIGELLLWRSSTTSNLPSSPWLIKCP